VHTEIKNEMAKPATQQTAAAAAATAVATTREQERKCPKLSYVQKTNLFVPVPKRASLVAAPQG